MHVLVALDDSDPAEKALDYVLEEYSDAEITLLHVIDPAESVYGEAAHVGPSGLIEQRRTEAEGLLETAVSRAADHEGDVRAETMVGRPAVKVTAFADENDVDLIVAGSHGRSGVSRVLLGSVAEHIARRSSVPVTIIR